jgi:DNA invertase Pin-like site-specific DNA recombinase
MSRVFAYARVSTTEQVTSNQREQIAAAGYEVKAMRFIEETISGSVHVTLPLKSGVLRESLHSSSVFLRR